MSAANILLLVLYALGMATGQILFKVAANDTVGAPDLLPSLITNRPFWLAVALYGSLTVVWVWLLTRIPLVYAYPFGILAFVFTPVFAILFLHERIGGGYLFGSLLIVLGLAVITMTARA